MALELDERKMKILQAVIRNYLETGEPVGSRTISKYTDLNLSSATIRNEMADLEEMGYIIQPHTSAGRVPSDKGYRLYVDTLMINMGKELEKKTKEVEELKDLLLEKEEKMDQMLKQVAKTLAVNTNYASIISAPSVKGNRLKFLQLSRVDANQLVVVIVLEGNIIRNSILDMDDELDDETLLKLNVLLNTHLNGLPIEQINLGLIASLKQQAGIHSEIVGNVIDAVAESIRNDEDLEIYTSGTTNIFRYPELADQEKAKEIINTFEEKHLLATLVNDDENEDGGSENETGIRVYIGDETKVSSMKNCSVVTATYDLGDGMKGTFGIVGPKRMDYEKVVGTMKNMVGQLKELYNKKE